ncbi:MAG: phage terminase large subunit family protein [Candidatus Eisenbacteria sp.]|nr:phage terminase large subunit family protein [Candidatus Eisenbacteria bacterium]
MQNIRLEGRPFRFEGHEYLRAIYDDVSPHVVLSKAAQIGGTVWAILRSLHACLSGLNVLYYFPTRTDVIDFSKSRVTPLLNDNPFLSKLMTDTDTAGLKRIGDAHLYLRGMLSSVGLKSVPGDLLVFDELDEAPPAAKAMAKERLAHSDYRRMIELSNPSLPDYGIDEQYEKSDQRHWTIRCPACGQWTAPVKAFPTRLGEEVRIIRARTDGSHYLACPKCGGGTGCRPGGVGT